MSTLTTVKFVVVLFKCQPFPLMASEFGIAPEFGMSSIFTIPAPLKAFYSHFPLKTWDPIYPEDANAIDRPTVWILPPRTSSSDLQPLLLSSDVECLKWQAFIALRGLSDVAVRWDVSPDGGIDGRLPNLHVPRETSPDDGGGELLAAHMIPGWVDKIAGEVGPLEGYKDKATKDESHAWVSLLEGKVHAALVKTQSHWPKNSMLTCHRLFHNLSTPSLHRYSCRKHPLRMAVLSLQSSVLHRPRCLDSLPCFHHMAPMSHLWLLSCNTKTPYPVYQKG